MSYKSLILLLEATPGIEPGYADLQSAASPLRHVAPRGRAYSRVAVVPTISIEIDRYADGVVIVCGEPYKRCAY